LFVQRHLIEQFECRNNTLSQPTTDGTSVQRVATNEVSSSDRQRSAVSVFSEPSCGTAYFHYECLSFVYPPHPPIYSVESWKLQRHTHSGLSLSMF